MKFKMSENLKKQVEAQIRYNRKYKKGESSFVNSINKLLKEDFKDQDGAEEMANRLGIGRTIFYGGMGLIKE